MGKAELRAIISADARRFNRTINRIKTTVAATAKVAKAATIAGSLFSVKQALNFEKRLAEVNTLAKLGRTDLNRLKQEVINLGQELGVTTDTLVGGLYQALSAGLPTENAIDFLRVASTAAIAGVSDTATSVDALTTVLDSYNLSADEAGKVSDLLFTTVALGKTKFSELGNNIGRVASTANVAGVDIVELFAALSVLTKTMRTDEAVIALNQAILKLLPQIRERGLVGALKEAETHAGGNILAMKKLFGNVRALRGALALTGENMATFTATIEKMKSSTGAADKAFQIMASTGANRLQKILSQLQGLAITVGDELMPQFEAFADRFSQIVGDPDSLENIKSLISIFAMIASGIEKALDALFKFGNFISRFTPLGAAIHAGPSILESGSISQAVTPEQLANLRQFRKITGAGVEDIGEQFIQTNLIRLIVDELKNIGMNTEPIRTAQ